MFTLLPNIVSFLTSSYNRATERTTENNEIHHITPSTHSINDTVPDHNTPSTTSINDTTPDHITHQTTDNLDRIKAFLALLEIENDGLAKGDTDIDCLWEAWGETQRFSDAASVGQSSVSLCSSVSQEHSEAPEIAITCKCSIKEIQDGVKLRSTNSALNMCENLSNVIHQTKDNFTSITTEHYISFVEDNDEYNIETTPVILDENSLSLYNEIATPVILDENPLSLFNEIATALKAANSETDIHAIGCSNFACLKPKKSLSSSHIDLGNQSIITGNDEKSTMHCSSAALIDNPMHSEWSPALIIDDIYTTASNSAVKSDSMTTISSTNSVIEIIDNVRIINAISHGENKVTNGVNTINSTSIVGDLNAATENDATVVNAMIPSSENEDLNAIEMEELDVICSTSASETDVVMIPTSENGDANAIISTSMVEMEDSNPNAASACVRPKAIIKTTSESKHKSEKIRFPKRVHFNINSSPSAEIKKHDCLRRVKRLEHPAHVVKTIEKKTIIKKHNCVKPYKAAVKTKLQAAVKTKLQAAVKLKPKAAVVSKAKLINRSFSTVARHTFKAASKQTSNQDSNFLES